MQNGTQFAELALLHELTDLRLEKLGGWIHGQWYGWMGGSCGRWARFAGGSRWPYA
jgi:hypothetical protein